MRVGWCRHIDGVHRRIGEERAGVVIPTRHAMAAGIIGGTRAVAPHHGDELRARGEAEAGAALDLGDIAAPDDAPAHEGAAVKLRREHGGETWTTLAGAQLPIPSGRRCRCA